MQVRGLVCKGLDCSCFELGRGKLRIEKLETRDWAETLERHVATPAIYGIPMRYGSLDTTLLVRLTSKEWQKSSLKTVGFWSQTAVLRWMESPVTCLEKLAFTSVESGDLDLAHPRSQLENLQTLSHTLTPPCGRATPDALASLQFGSRLKPLPEIYLSDGYSNSVTVPSSPEFNPTFS